MLFSLNWVDSKYINLNAFLHLEKGQQILKQINNYFSVQFTNVIIEVQKVILKNIKRLSLI